MRIMSYVRAIDKSWKDISLLTKENTFSLRLCSDTYTVDLNKQNVFSLSCNVPAKDYVSIILLHYLTAKLKLKELPAPSGEWIDFNQLESGEFYYPAFKKRTIDQVLRKYGANPEALLDIDKRLPARKAQAGDTGMIIDALEGVPIIVALWRADDEFAPDANILFDKSISKIFCTEDIVVLSELIVHQL